LQMRHSFCLMLFLCVLVPLAMPVRQGLGAQSPQPASTASTVILTEENDYFAGTDNHYTNGIKLSWVSGDLKKYAEDERLPQFVLPYLRLLPFVNEPGQQYNVALSLGQNMYVPRNTTINAAQPDDRPYAGWSYVALALHAKTATQLDTFETSVGVVGALGPLARGNPRIITTRSWVLSASGVGAPAS